MKYDEWLSLVKSLDEAKAILLRVNQKYPHLLYIERAIDSIAQEVEELEAYVWDRGM